MRLTGLVYKKDLCIVSISSGFLVNKYNKRTATNTNTVKVELIVKLTKTLFIEIKPFKQFQYFLHDSYNKLGVR